jgi:hypothetical protein
MTLEEMHALRRKYGRDRFKIAWAVHLHDEDEQNERTLSFDGVIVGSELVPVDFVEENIQRVMAVKNLDRV